MKDYGCSRTERFEIEKPLLQPIPTETFEITERRIAKVHPDCHIEYGCKQARSFGRLKLKYITDCATRFHKNGARPVLVKTASQRDLDQLCLHEHI